MLIVMSGSQMKYLLVLLLVLAVHGKVSAEGEKLARPIEPLPMDQVSVLFDLIERKQQIPEDLLHRALVGPQFALRADAARLLGDYGSKSSVPYLIDALSDDSIHVGALYLDDGMATTRYWANKSLIKLTGKDFGFEWGAEAAKRSEATMRWIQWYKQLQSISQT